MAQHPIADLNAGLQSPSFKMGYWRVAVEHQRQFKSVVVQWRGSSNSQPAVPTNWQTCPPSDQAKGWSYRVSVSPADFQLLLMQLESGPISVEDCNGAFESRVESAKLDTRDARLARLESALKIPRKVQATTTVFLKNADVVAEALFRAAGNCEGCTQPAPFAKRVDGEPYLEVHHRTPLAAGGEDTVTNAIALCPNCHRRAHYASQLIYPDAASRRGLIEALGRTKPRSSHLCVTISQ